MAERQTVGPDGGLAVLRTGQYVISAHDGSIHSFDTIHVVLAIPLGYDPNQVTFEIYGIKYLAVRSWLIWVSPEMSQVYLNR